MLAVRCECRALALHWPPIASRIGCLQCRRRGGVGCVGFGVDDVVAVFHQMRHRWMGQRRRGVRNWASMRVHSSRLGWVQQKRKTKRVANKRKMNWRKRNSQVCWCRTSCASRQLRWMLFVSRRPSKMSTCPKSRHAVQRRPVCRHGHGRVVCDDECAAVVVVVVAGAVVGGELVLVAVVEESEVFVAPATLAPVLVERVVELSVWTVWAL